MEKISWILRPHWRQAFERLSNCEEQTDQLRLDMKRISLLQHEFVEFIPNELIDGHIYISIRFRSVSHRCCCGCGIKTVTPLNPRDWTLLFDGKTVSLTPSIGNWSLDCQSHYWICRNEVVWARQFSKSEIDAGRALERFRRARSFSEKCICLARFIPLWIRNKLRH